MSSKPSCIIIVGPTASGKSLLAMHLAKKLGATIINGDSRQVFAELPILSAIPTPSDQKDIVHQLYSYRSWQDGPTNPAHWAQEAAMCIKKNTRSIIVGGTGFYINTLVHGISPIPPIHPAISALAKICTHACIAKRIYKLLKHWDPQTSFHPNNRVKLHRALCIAAQTHKKPSYWKTVPYKKFTLNRFFIIALAPEKKQIDQYIANRAQAMLDSGVLDEVHTFYNTYQTTPPVIGFETLLQHTQSAISRQQATERLIYETRRYAKRQLAYNRHHIKHHMLLPYVFDGTQWDEFEKKWDDTGAVEEN